MDNVLTVFLHAAIIAVIVFLIGLSKSVEIKKLYLLELFFIYFLYYTSIFFENDFIYSLRLAEGLGWNWGGKIISFCVFLMTIAYLYRAHKNFCLSDVGVTFVQSKNSIMYVSIAFVLLVFFPFVVSDFSVSNKDVETLLFQASLPGISEEPMYRGVFLYLLCKGIHSKSISILSAKVDYGCVLSLLLFGFGHGLFIENYEVKVSAGEIISSMIYGAIFLWFRLVTGSLFFPVVVHNLTNVARYSFD